MKETRLTKYSSFWLGSRGSAEKDNFYRINSRDRHASTFNETAYAFIQSQSQRVITFTRYSVIDVIQVAPVLIFSVLRFLQASSSSFSDFNLKFNTINKLFTVKKLKNKE